MVDSCCDALQTKRPGKPLRSSAAGSASALPSDVDSPVVCPKHCVYAMNHRNNPPRAPKSTRLLSRNLPGASAAARTTATSRRSALRPAYSPRLGRTANGTLVKHSQAIAPGIIVSTSSAQIVNVAGDPPIVVGATAPIAGRVSIRRTVERTGGVAVPLESEVDSPPVLSDRADTAARHELPPGRQLRFQIAVPRRRFGGSPDPPQSRPPRPSRSVRP